MHIPSRRKRRAALVVVGYGLLLAISYLVRWQASAEQPVPTASVETLEAVDGDRQLDRPVRLVYEDHPARVDGAAPPVILLHGSPGSRHDFRAIRKPLAQGHRVIVPDLPGFGESTARVPDYSIRAHARYVLALMDRLAIRRAHLVGFSMGGGVSLSVYDLAPDRVASVTLLSAIGVQELELFGTHRLNHLVHGAQVAGLWLAHHGLPHMGLLDDTMLDLAYARNFYDSDQRPLRGVLERFEPPMLVIHGRDDFLVVPEAAVEHHRIVPHSELQMLDASHFMVFSGSQDLALRIGTFLESVDAGRAATRASATESRLLDARAPFDPSALPALSGIALLITVVAIALATLISEDLTCVWVGLMVGHGRIEFLPGVIGCCAGIFIGDLLLFLAGKLAGQVALHRAPLRWFLRPETVDLSSRWLARRGLIVIFISRFMPGTRLPTYFAAGLLRMTFWRFGLYFMLAVVAWTPVLVGLAAVLGDRAFGAFEAFQRHALPVAILLGLWIFFVVKIGLGLTTHRGRRLLVGRWRRTIRWEFWPPWVFYPPVVLYVVLLGLRHRSPLLFTAANPAMDAGGFISESKHAILGGLADAGSFVARSCLVPADASDEERAGCVRRFMEENGLTYPVVLKPDAGQRGSGVAVVRGEESLRSYLVRAHFDVVAQEYAPGREFGVFYYRHPGSKHGRIFSVTDKQIPVVVGDGRRTVERLILDDPRAVCMANRYLEAQAARLDDVPEAGCEVRLVELGTHCRGAIFLDGSAVMTEALERRIDEISRGYRGFYFGRYDLRAPDLQRMQRGEGFKIIELNGVTSEATHIYDPAIGLFRAYRTLFAQWRIAFEIGRRNRDRGVEPVRLRHLARLLAEYRRSSRSHP